MIYFKNINSLKTIGLILLILGTYPIIFRPRIIQYYYLKFKKYVILRYRMNITSHQLLNIG
jgi:hypothetical protein